MQIAIDTLTNLLSDLTDTVENETTGLVVKVSSAETRIGSIESSLNGEEGLIAQVS